MASRTLGGSPAIVAHNLASLGYQLGGCDGRHSTKPQGAEVWVEKDVASKVLEILSVRTKGNHADVEVAIERTATINGRVYTHSTATFGMVGEGKTWHYATYKEGNWFTP